ncbi:MAG: helix-turn-helix domain-containing protein [Armatimonadota bacterium]|nr:helix-turn-helix domain-containing protein [Armatimonadota bacterium]MDW8291353.1 helix-turn-helix domain-containing protein [Armatimonadota bacterium]
MQRRVRREFEKVAPPEVMGVQELADYLRISVHTVYRLAEQGRIPGRKVGKRWRFHREAIVGWLATQHEQDGLTQ